MNFKLKAVYKAAVCLLVLLGAMGAAAQSSASAPQHAHVFFRVKAVDSVGAPVSGRLLAEALRRRIREQLGKTYSPMVDVPTPDNSDQGMVFALVDAAPADVDQVRGEVLKAADAVAHGDFDQAALDQARAPLVAQLESGKFA